MVGLGAEVGLGLDLLGHLRHEVGRLLGGGLHVLRAALVAARVQVRVRGLVLLLLLRGRVRVRVA